MRFVLVNVLAEYRPVPTYLFLLHTRRAMIQAPATLTGLDQGDGSEPPNLNQARIKTQKQREEHPDR